MSRQCDSFAARMLAFAAMLEGRMKTLALALLATLAAPAAASMSFTESAMCRMRAAMPLSPSLRIALVCQLHQPSSITAPPLCRPAAAP